MAYFPDNYGAISFPLETDEEPGWRLAQAGALHALAGHFYSKNDRALVAMPTGSGKSAIFMALPFLLRANRVLIVTTSRVVRDQITEDYDELSTLKAMGAVSEGCPSPRVRSVSSREEVKNLAKERNQYDVAVAVPAAFQTVDLTESLPPDLFDLLIVDEAHHLAAPTWTALTKHFSASNQALFTATPVRRDSKSLGAKYVYVYTLAEALRDGVFCVVNFRPVFPQGGLDIDTAIALETEQQFHRDQADGKDHRVLVRVDSRKRADELGKLYERETDLRLRVIHSGHAYSRVRKALSDLISGQLDGLISVDMLGEGFDFPKLKIGAIHTPHKSLSATLQFIGRFARINGQEVGEAVLVGAESDVKLQAKPLWVQNAAWHQLIPSLSDAAIYADVAAQEFFSTFDAPQPPNGEVEVSMLATEGLRPPAHVKAYELQNEPNLDVEIILPDGFSICHSQSSDETKTRVLVILEKCQPRWTDDPLLARLEYDLIVLHYHPMSEVLFIGSSRRSDELYECLAKNLSAGKHSILPLFKLARVLRGLDGLECFSVGMRNRLVGTTAESYRIMVGPCAQRAIRNVDSIAYHRGHVFARGERQGQVETLGYSSSSKIWSASGKDLAGFVSWCDQLGSALADDTHFSADERLEILPSGGPATAPIPPLLAGLWPKRAYERALKLTWPGGERLLRDLDIHLPVRTADASSQQVQVLTNEDVLAEFVYEPEMQPFFNPIADQDLADFVVTDYTGETEVPLLDFLRSDPPQFFTADFGSYCGSEFFECPVDKGLYDAGKLLSYDWIGADVNIKCETQRSNPGPGKKYILEEYPAVLVGDFAHVLIDDGSGEAADIIACNINEDTVTVRLVHCKASRRPAPGHRVDDVYVVSGQVIKSVRLVGANRKLRDHLSSRANLGVIAGNLNDVLLALDDGSKRKEYEVQIVQPGIAVAEITPAMLRPLAAAEDYVLAAGCTSFTVVGSP